jgi:hypothetical protein
MLEKRERVILEVLKKLPEDSIILIGGYAVNAYVPPRFSIDCDLVVLDKLEKIKKILTENGFKETDVGETPYGGKYYRLERAEEKIYFDLLFRSVLDRESGISFSSELIEKHSKERITVGKANPIRIGLKIIDPVLLFALKFVCCRKQDIRDIFMLSGLKLDWNLIKEILFKKCSKKILEERIENIKKTVKNKTFRDSLQGAFGAMPTETFDSCKKNLLNFLESMTPER